jgi:hypothetical protein
MIDRDGVLGTFIRWTFIPLFAIVTIIAVPVMIYLSFWNTTFWTILLSILGLPLIVATWSTFYNWAKENGSYEGLKEDFLPTFGWCILGWAFITTVILIAIGINKWIPPDKNTLKTIIYIIYFVAAVAGGKLLYEEVY